MARTTLTPDQWYGWDADLTVEAEQMPADFGVHGKAASAIYVDGALVGYVIGQVSRGQRYYGYVTSEADARGTGPTRITFGSPRRSMAVADLITASKEA